MNILRQALVPILLVTALVGFIFLYAFFVERPHIVLPEQKIPVENTEHKETVSEVRKYHVSDFIEEDTIATSTKIYVDPDGRFTFEYASTLKPAESNTNDSNELLFCELDAGYNCDMGQGARVRIRIFENPEHVSLGNFTKELYTYENELEEVRHQMYEATIDGTTKAGYPMILAIDEDIHGKAIDSDILIALPDEVIVFNDFNFNLPVVYTQTMVHTFKLK